METLKRVKLRHCAKFRGDRSNHCWNMAIFFSRFMAAVLSAILDLLCACLNHPRSALVVFITVQNVVGIDAVVLIICMFLISRIWLDNAYSRPQNWSFRGFDPYIGVISTKPKKTHIYLFNWTHIKRMWKAQIKSYSKNTQKIKQNYTNTGEQNFCD